ncbi:MAG: VWA domain-containing protein [Thermoanaerobaculia bacterium]|nr:VWA domain-containing protein [Thermoanaerobaculia bacterium]
MIDPARSFSFRTPAVKPRKRWAAVLLLIALTTFRGGPEATAQKNEPPKDAAPRFEGSADVLVVQVPVTVTDRDGKPLRGLTAADFELYDENERRELTGFEVIDISRLPRDQGNRAPEIRALDSSARRHFLLLFDLSFSDPNALVRARVAARDLVLNQLHPADLAAVATFSAEHGPRLLVTFTPDRAQLARAIDTLGIRGLLARTATDPLSFVIETPELRADNSVGETVGSASGRGIGAERELRRDANEAAVQENLRVIGRQFDRSQRAFERNRITDWSRQMADLARSLDSVAGRKQVVLFSEGFDSNLLMGRAPTVNDQEAQQDAANILGGRLATVDSDQLYGSTGLHNELRDMLQEFRRADCVFQAVDIGGLRAGADIRDTLGNRGQDGLFYMANETGGLLFKDANFLADQMSALLEATSVTYLLAFQPEKVKYDGSFRRLRIKLAESRRGAKLAYRAGYYMPRPYQELATLEKNLLASDAIASASPRNEIRIDLLAVPFRASDESAYVPVILEIDGGPLLQDAKEDRLAVEIYTYVTDQKGEIRDFFTDQVTLDLKRGREALERTGLKYYGHLDLAPGSYLVRSLVRNGSTGRSGITTLPLEVPSFAATSSVLLTPLFADQPGQWVLARQSEDESSRGTVVYPFTIKGDPFIPAARPSLKSGESARLCLVAYNLGAGDLEVTSRILGADGVEIPGGRVGAVERTATGIAGLDKLVATFEPPKLSPGNGYTLEILVTDSTRGAVEASSIPFSYWN